jgi:hypothetical protein
MTDHGDARTIGVATAKTFARTVHHVTIETGRTFDDFRSAYEAAVPSFDRLEAVGVVLSGAGWDGIRGLSLATAVHGFVNFFTFDPSPVMKLNGNSRRAVTYLAGNIIEAEKGFRLDPSCFLYVPLRVVIAERSDGIAEMSFDQPDDLFSAFDNHALQLVGKDFTSALAGLLAHLGLPIPLDMRSETR